MNDISDYITIYLFNYLSTLLLLLFMFCLTFLLAQHAISLLSACYVFIRALILWLLFLSFFVFITGWMLKCHQKNHVLHYVRRHKVYLTQNSTSQVVWGFFSGTILLEPVSSLSGEIFNLLTKLLRVTSCVAAAFILVLTPLWDCLYLLPTS